MKSFKKMFWIVSALFVLTGAGIFTSCSNDDDEDNTTPTSQPSAYSISITNADKAITLAPGGTKKISVTKNGSMGKPAAVEGLTVTVSNSESTITITADSSITEKTEKTVKVTLVEDASKAVTIAVSVEPTAPVTIDAYDLTLTLDSTVASSAASITVYAEGKEDNVDCPENKKQTVTAEYTAGATTAIAKLDKAKANEWKYFNNIVVTVKDASDNEIPIEYTPVYFDYSNTEFSGITISAKSTSKTFTINFEGFTVVGGSVSGLKVSNTWYSSSAEWQDGTTLTPAVTVAADGKSATFNISSSDLVAGKNEFYIDWSSVEVKDSSGTPIAINSGNSETNKWYSYSGAEWSNTLEVVNSTSATPVSSDSLTITTEETYQLVVSYDSIKNYSTVYITLAAITAWGNGSYDLPCLGTSEGWKSNTAWVDSGAFVDSNVTSTTGGYYASINPADYPDGVYITGKTGLAGTLFVSGK